MYKDISAQEKGGIDARYEGIDFIEINFVEMIIYEKLFTFKTINLGSTVNF